MAKKQRSLLAAALCLTLALAGCGHSEAGEMTPETRARETRQTEILLETTAAAEPETQAPAAEALPPETEAPIVFSFDSWKDSPEHQASREWLQFRIDHDPDHSISQSYSDRLLEKQQEDPSVQDLYPAPYCNYTVIDDVTLEKLKEIAEAYDLALISEKMSASYNMEPAENHLPGYLGRETFLLDPQVRIESLLNCKITPEGLFATDFFLKMPDTRWENPILCTFRCTPRGYLVESAFFREGEHDWEILHHETPQGAKLVILHEKEGVNAWAFCQREDALISLRFEASYMTYSDNAVDSQYMTDQQLCQVAEAFDYSLVLNPDWDFIQGEIR